MFASRRYTHSRVLASAGLAALIPAAVGGCETAALTPTDRPGNPSAASSESAAASTAPTASTGQKSPIDNATVDRSHLLLQAADLSDDEDTFAVRSSNEMPNEMAGANALFVNTHDTRAISDTIVVYPDAATATATLRQATATAHTAVVGGTAQPSSVGTDGTKIVGRSPDGGKAVTLLLFTQGPALVRLAFESAAGDVAPDGFVTNVGKMQQIALRVGLVE